MARFEPESGLRCCAPAEGLTRHPFQGGVCDHALPYVNLFAGSRLPMSCFR